MRRALIKNQLFFRVKFFLNIGKLLFKIAPFLLNLVVAGLYCLIYGLVHKTVCAAYSLIKVLVSVCRSLIPVRNKLYGVVSVAVAYIRL